MQYYTKIISYYKKILVFRYILSLSSCYSVFCFYRMLTYFFQHISQFVPFGIGRRICAGESLASSEVFIFFVMMIQRIKFLKPMNNPVPSIKNYKASFTNIPAPFYVSISGRWIRGIKQRNKYVICFKHFTALKIFLLPKFSDALIKYKSFLYFHTECVK